MSNAYVIPDEPTPTTLNRFAVRPDGPLLATFMCGAWLGLPWFAFNAYAIGSPTRRREVAAVLAAIGATALAAMILLGLMDRGIVVSPTAINIGALLIATLKLGMAYYLSILQGRTFHVYEYYGGAVRRAYPFIVLGVYLRPLILSMIDDPIWRIIVSGGL